MALVFWTEPIPTYDLDVLVLLPEHDTPLVSLSGIYEWAAARGYPADAEHVIIADVPVQFLPAHDELADQAIETAATLDYEGVPVRVVRPEYLIALYLEPSARTAIDGCVNNVLSEAQKKRTVSQEGAKKELIPLQATMTATGGGGEHVELGWRQIGHGAGLQV